MGFLLPSALALAGLAVPIIIFYMLKLRRQPARVSSLLLWQQVLQDRQANAPWQRLRRNLLLLLQLIILALLVLALARPYFTVQARVQGNVVLLLDASASMQATDVAPSRFAAARQLAQDLIDRLDPGDAVTLIAVEGTPRILTPATTDRGLLRRALAAARPTSGPADWEAALTLAAANAATLRGPEATVTILSDGAFAADDLPVLPVPVEFITVGQGAGNQGLVALSLRDGPDGPELFLRAANAAAEPAQRLVEIRVDGQLFDARFLDIPPNAAAGLTVGGLPLASRQVEARLREAPGDLLPADDVAWAVRSAGSARVLVVGEGNLFLERALALLPGVEVQRAAPDQPLPHASPPFDLTIFDRALPAADALPEGNLFFIAPPASTSLFEVSGALPASQTRVTRFDGEHPLLTFVQFNNLHVARAQAVRPPAWGSTLVDAAGGPLLIAGQSGGRRIAILTFDLHQSDLPLQIDFPIFVVNLSRWLLPGRSLAQGQSLQAGQPFILPTTPSASALLVNTPSGGQVTLRDSLDPGGDSSAGPGATFGDTFELGVYQVFAHDAGRAETVPVTSFAVNLLDETETDIRPGRAQISGSVGPEGARELTGRREWWWLAALLGLGVLLAEWWVYWRGEVR